ncbi:MAG TPA: ABC transporter permease [Desulfurivibrio alkaliphilus]|uniref:ABC transporter permease n=1 Tax=Desulfurivibrio alkaliphilus TaxID=427923 RepID=A0A7C2TI34_9BACT|nr:ABC transporter permease [Desulfurivibrio alkaliphilus]
MAAEFRRLKTDPWFVIGGGLALMLALLLLFAPWLMAHDPHEMSFPPLTPPSATHWLGVNDGGMDIWAELLTGLGNTLAFGLITGLLGLALAAAIGLSSAWFRGITDGVLMRLADLLLAVPAVMILILLAAFFQPGPAALALILALLAWPSGAKVIRAQALTLQGRGHLLAARQMGAGSSYIIVRHLLPELFPLYLISFAALVRMAVFMEASLSFLGLFDPGRKSLGMMIRQALNYYYLEVWWHWLLPPILLLTLLVMAFTFLAVSLEKFFDPRLRGV